MSEQKKLIGPVEVGNILGVTSRTVMRWADTGLLPVAFRMPGGARRFWRADIEAAAGLSTGRAGELFGVASSTVQRWVAQGLLPAFKSASGHLRLREADALAAIERWRQPGADSADPVIPPRPPRFRTTNAKGRRWPLMRVHPKTPEETKREARKAAAIARRKERLDTFLSRRFGMTRRELYDLVWSEPVERVAKRFGMSGNALRKTCRRYKIPVPRRGYWRNLTAKRLTKVFRRPTLRAPTTRTEAKYSSNVPPPDHSPT